MITAKEYCEKRFKESPVTIAWIDFNVMVMNEYAKLHRKAIIEEIAENYLYYLEGDEGSERLDKEKFFKEIYPLNNIK